MQVNFKSYISDVHPSLPDACSFIPDEGTFTIIEEDHSKCKFEIVFDKKHVGEQPGKSRSTTLNVIFQKKITGTVLKASHTVVFSDNHIRIVQMTQREGHTKHIYRRLASIRLLVNNDLNVTHKLIVKTDKNFSTHQSDNPFFKDLAWL